MKSSYELLKRVIGEDNIGKMTIVPLNRDSKNPAVKWSKKDYQKTSNQAKKNH